MRRLIISTAFLALATPAIAASGLESLGLDELSPEMRGSLTDRLRPGQDPAELVETTRRQVGRGRKDPRGDGRDLRTDAVARNERDAHSLRPELSSPRLRPCYPCSLES